MNTGGLLNKLALKKKIIFVKLTNKEELHNGFQYQDGLNIDVHKFCPYTGIKGGFAFTITKSMHMWIDYPSGSYYIIDEKTNKKIWYKYPDPPMYWIRHVIIPDDAMVSIHGNVIKTDKFILKKRNHIWSDVKLCLYMIKQDDQLIKYVNKSIA